MKRRVSRRPRRAQLATALLRRKLNSSVLDIVEELVDELKDHSGTLPPSTLFQPRVVRKTLLHARYVMARNPTHGLALAHLATLTAPHTPARTPYETKRAIVLEGDAYRLYAAALLRCGRNYDAQRAAEESRRLLEIPAVKKLTGKLLVKLHMTLGQILFNLGEIERGLAMISMAADRAHVIYGDVLLFLHGRQNYGALLIYLKRWEEAADVFDEVLEIANETNYPEIKAAITYNVSLCGKHLGERHADECHAGAMKLMKKTRLAREIPGREEWIRVMELKQLGRMNEAISEMYKIRTKYFDKGLELRAHDEVSPNIVDALMAIRRRTEARNVGLEAMEKLAAAGMKRSEERIRISLYGPSAAPA